MNIRCKHCGRQHALFWFQGVSARELSYTCDRYPAKMTNKTSGRPEVRSIRKRLIYREAVGDLEAAGIPTRLTRAVKKRETDAHQEKLQL